MSAGARGALLAAALLGSVGELPPDEAPLLVGYEEPPTQKRRKRSRTDRKRQAKAKAQRQARKRQRRAR